MPALVTFSNSKLGFISFICAFNFDVIALKFMLSLFNSSFISLLVMPFGLFNIALYTVLAWACVFKSFSFLAVVLASTMLFAAFAIDIALSNSVLDSLVKSVRSVFIISDTSYPRFIGMIRNLVFMRVLL